MANDKITTLSEENLDYLLSKTPKVMPDNPSANGWSGARVRRVLYEGYIILFEWLKRLSIEVKDKTDILQLDLNDVILSNGYKSFDLELQTPVVAEDIDNDEYMIDLTATTEQVRVIEDYLAYVGGKTLNLYINRDMASEYAFIHSRIRKYQDEIYDLEGICVREKAKVYAIKATIDRDNLLWNIQGTIQGIANEISLKALEQKIADEYVAKKDLEISEEEIHGLPYDIMTITLNKK